MKIEVGVNDKHEVFINFPSPTKVVGFSPDDAMELGKVLIFKSAEASLNKRHAVESTVKEAKEKKR